MSCQELANKTCRTESKNWEGFSGTASKNWKVFRKCVCVCVKTCAYTCQEPSACESYVKRMCDT